MSFDMDRAVGLAIDTMTEFTTVLETETAAVRDRRTGELETLVPHKEKLAHQLEVLLGGLRTEKARLAAHLSARAGLKERLVAVWNGLAAAAADNAQTLQHAQRLTQSVVDLVVDVARRQQQAENGYAKTGYGRRGQTGGSTLPSLSVALNTTL
ncbi:flagellar export chaperone FlgN [Arenibaculum sp.]|uniref:flagellar export chaperone FlgN n=1 Tax=Arenibaculum sp. TaxID=2865862 RepID=UPI002E10C175|nr:flagellar export chaperone FlgN [Arenibaculum sp.]